MTRAMSNTTKKQLKRKRRKAEAAAPRRSRPSSKVVAASGASTPHRLAMEPVLAGLTGSFGGGGGRGPRDEAQDLIYAAWEANSIARRVDLARRALQISKDCVDAHVILAEVAATPAEALDCYRQGVAAGERSLGHEYFADNAGHFWGLIETRPYMRARAGLSELLWETGARDESIEHALELLRLNPNDNQGVRQGLVPRLIELGRYDAAEEVLSRYEDDAFAGMQYAQALSAFARLGDVAAARDLLARAMKANPFVPPYLLGKKKLPRQLPDFHGFGDDAEAVVYVAQGGAAWKAVPGAVAWLAAV